MNSFGKIKTKVLKKLVESYSSNKKNDVKEILKTLKENKEFKDMYLFYEEIEKLEMTYPDSAELYVETLEPLLNKKMSNITDTCEKLSKLLEGVDVENNELYEHLDILSESTTLNNLDKKVLAKKKIIEHLKSKKEINESSNSNFIANENLLHAVLTNNFNVTFNNSLNEEQKNELKDILSLTFEDLSKKSQELKESLFTKIESIVSETTDDSLKTKLDSVKKEVNEMDVSRYNYYKLIELKNGLN